MNSDLNLNRIADETFVRHIDYHTELGSTNDHALELAASIDEHSLPLLVLAAQQTNGRGRGDNRWWTGAGSLPFSLLVSSPSNTPDPRVALAAGLAVADAIASLGDHDETIGLKWPNDVYLGNRKVCGILVEVPARPASRVVLGIGINVNNSFAAAPQEIAQRGISLNEACGHAIPRDDVLIAVLRFLDTELERLRHDRLDLRQRWQDRDVLAGRQIQLQVGSRTIEGRSEGIGDDGALWIRTSSGRQRCLTGIVRDHHDGA